MKTAVYTTFYQAASPYFAGWYQSLCSQSDRDVDVWIGLDSLSPAEAQRFAGAAIPATWVQQDVPSSPATIRSKALEALVPQYDCVVLTDVDDLLGEGRIEAAKKALQTYDVVGCALQLMNGEGHDLNRVFRPDASSDPKELLVRHNVFGFSNTAYRCEALQRCLPIPDDCQLSDWYLATRAWYSDAQLGFDYAPRMYYRQYGNNMAGVLPPFSGADIVRATRLVLTHYRLVLDAPGSYDDKRRRVEAARRRAEFFYQAITASSDCLATYARALNALEPTYIWWWCVANSELEELWNR